jgi:transcriptional regulator with XRE-family HTH domain
MYPNLKLTIFKRGLRQNHLAREVGIHEVALSKIIHGVREPSPTQRLLLCQYLGAEESWLFEKYVGGMSDVRVPRTETPERENGDV